jgi:nitroimidazol reductase NimA-like FMN-containing flavoprotein (pyridoxamine 5'-phosphate oxidase superfamily)
MEAGPGSSTQIRRHPERAVYDRAAIDAILDEALFCHVAFEHDGRPFAIPTIHARVGDVLYLHGSPASRMLRRLHDGIEVCVTVTLVDGVVLARSVFNHSLNYRSVIALGRARALEDLDEKLAALRAIVEHVVPGRSADARGPNDSEVAATSVLALPITEASAKVRAGPPKDFDADLGLPIWAGVIPLQLRAAEPQTEARVPRGVVVPSYARRYRRPVGPAEHVVGMRSSEQS